jgi:drug/metabolite transporter (DMT)-like permease
MSPAAILLILVAAVAHACWNLSAKRAGGGTAFAWLYLVASTVLLVPAVVLDLVIGRQHPSWIWLGAASVSGLLQLGYFLLLRRGYAVGDMSVVYPLARGTGPLLSVLFAVVLLGERLPALALAGAGAVVAGVVVIGSGGSDDSPHGSGRNWRSLGYALATGATIAAYTLWDANAVTTLNVPPLVEFAGGTVVQVLVLTPYALARRRSLAGLWRAHRADALVIAVLSPLAYVLVLYAMRIAPVALVAPARELSIVVGGVIAWRVLGEPRPFRRLAGSVVVLAGVVALALS